MPKPAKGGPWGTISLRKSKLQHLMALAIVRGNGGTATSVLDDVLDDYLNEHAKGKKFKDALRMVHKQDEARAEMKAFSNPPVS